MNTEYLFRRDNMLSDELHQLVFLRKEKRRMEFSSIYIIWGGGGE